MCIHFINFIHSKYILISQWKKKLYYKKFYKYNTIKILYKYNLAEIIPICDCIRNSENSECVTISIIYWSNIQIVEFKY